jgi:hypothetical protein
MSQTVTRTYPLFLLFLLVTAGCTSASTLEGHDTATDHDGPGERAGAPSALPLLAYCTVITNSDDPADGTIDSRQVEEFNALGLVEHIDFDDDADGQVDASLDATYDGFAQLIHEKGDVDQDGTIDWAVDYTWDDRGNLVFVEQVGESSAHGGTSSYTYDEDDLVETIEWDYDGDGRQDYLWDHLRDAEGLLLRVELWDLRSFLLGQEWLYLYDQQGRLVTTYNDVGADGRFEAVVRNRWDDQDRLSQQETDYYDDGSVNGLSVYSYDDGGRLVLEQYHRGPLNSPVTYSYASTWDDDGLLTRHETTWHHQSDSPRKVQTIERDCPPRD